MTPMRTSPKMSPITAGILQAQSLIRQRRLSEAHQLLAALEHKHPNHHDVLLGLAQVCEQLQDWPAVVGIGERLVRAHPRDPGLLFALGKAYVQARHLALAVRTFRRLVSENPEHQRADEAQKEVARLTEVLAPEIGRTGLPAGDALGALELTDEVRSLSVQRRYGEANQVAEKLTARFPRFGFGLNSLAQLHLAEGNLEQALLILDRALEVEPENLYVHTRRIRALCLLGRLEEARHHGQTLAAFTSGREDEELSRAEAHSYLGDDAAVLQAFQRAEVAGVLPRLGKAGIFYHLAAVAELRVGHEAKSAELWTEALRRSPSLEIARQNVADRCRPIGEQHAPWPFSLAMWVPTRTLENLNRAMQGRRTDEELRQGARNFLAQHPELAGLLPVLLDRGDPEARRLALNLARTARTEDLLVALRDFAQGTRGQDMLRNQAAQVAVEAGLLPAGPLRLWLRGAWRELTPFHCAWDQPAPPISPKVAQVLESIRELGEGNPLQAELRLRKAVEAEPDSPFLLHTLAAALSAQRRNREADALLDSIHRRFPDFVAAMTDIARRHLRRGEVDQAESLLKPLLARQRFVAGEFACLCMAQIEVLLARKNEAPLSIWLQMWEQATPDHPALEPFRKRVEQASPFSMWSKQP